MQKKFTKPVISVEPKNTDMRGYLFTKDKRFPKNSQQIKVLTFSRNIAFCVKQLGVAAYGEVIHSTCDFRRTQKPRFGRVVIEKKRKLSEK